MGKNDGREFVNQTSAFIGVVKINEKTGEEYGVVLEPGERVFLNDEEIQATDRAPRKRERSPFAPRDFLVKDAENPAAAGGTTKYGPAIVPADAPPEGSYAPGEMAGTNVG